MSNSMDRRDFLKAAGGTVAIASLPVMSAAVQGSLAPGCKFLTIPQAAMIESISEQMIPADGSPGGKVGRSRLLHRRSSGRTFRKVLQNELRRRSGND